MATSPHSVLGLLVLAAVLAPRSVAWSNCPPGSGGHGRPGYPSPGGGGGYSPPGYPAPGAGGGYSPPGSYPSPGGGGGGGYKPPHHGKPPKQHKPPPYKCPPCYPPYSPPPYKPPTPRPPPYKPPAPPYIPPYNPPHVPSPPYTPPSPPYSPPYAPPYSPPYNPPSPPPYTPPYNPPSPPYTPPGGKTCPIDTLKLNACVDVLGGLIHLVIGQEAKAKCCPLVQGVADLDAALCLCTTLRLKLLSIKIYLPVALNLLITCGKHPPHGFQCPPLYAAPANNKAHRPQLRA